MSEVGYWPWAPRALCRGSLGNVWTKSRWKDHEVTAMKTRPCLPSPAYLSTENRNLFFVKNRERDRGNESPPPFPAFRPFFDLLVIFHLPPALVDLCEVQGLEQNRPVCEVTECLFFLFLFFRNHEVDGKQRRVGYKEKNVSILFILSHVVPFSSSSLLSRGEKKRLAVPSFPGFPVSIPSFPSPSL